MQAIWNVTLCTSAAAAAITVTLQMPTAIRNLYDSELQAIHCLWLLLLLLL
jgi:hypothetical protein